LGLPRTNLSLIIHQLHLIALHSIVASLAAIPTAYATASAGMHPSHTLPNKLRALARAGCTAAEIAFPDLEAYASSLHDRYKQLDDAGRGDLDALLGAARQIRKLMQELGVRALTVMPYVRSCSARIKKRLTRLAGSPSSRATRTPPRRRAISTAHARGSACLTCVYTLRVPSSL
jgi:hypothetical protein